MGMRAGLAPISTDQLAALRLDPESILDESFAESERSIDLDKAWHGIHWLLTGSAWDGEPPLALAVFGGEEIGPDLEYGPAHVVAPEQVGMVATALSTITDEELRSRYDPRAMDAEKIYPDIWERDGAEGLAYLVHYFHILVKFYAEAAARGDAVLQWIS